VEVRLVGAAVWRASIEEASVRLSAPERNALVNCLQVAHNRHVGMTVGLAADLTALFFHRTTASTNPWLAVKQRLQTEVQADTQKGSFPILFMAHRGFVMMRLVLPLVAAACERRGRNLLHHESEMADDLNGDDYANHHRDLQAEITQLAESQDASWCTFFQQTGTTLAGLARKDAGKTAALLPTPDPMAYTLWQKLPVQASLPRMKASPTQQMNLTNQHREVRKRREGGINGVYLTRRPEDLDHILFSEFLNHRAVLAERLVNGGFLAYRRHPRREKLRHALVTALIPPGLELQSPQLTFVKVCWLHAMARFAWLLHRAKLAASEFRLVEGNPMGQVHTRAAVLSDMPQVAVNEQAQDMSSDFLRIFATALGWTPHLFETRPRFAQIDNQANRETWLAQIWRSQMDHPAWGRMAGKQNRSWDLSSYSYVHAMLILPIKLRDDETYHPAAVARSLGFSRHGNAYTSVLWVPNDWFESWSLEAGGKSWPLDFNEQSSEEVASALVQRILSQWIGEMSRGA
jgi:hypothetical protein